MTDLGGDVLAFRIQRSGRAGAGGGEGGGLGAPEKAPGSVGGGGLVPAEEDLVWTRPEGRVMVVWISAVMVCRVLLDRLLPLNAQITICALC